MALWVMWSCYVHLCAPGMFALIRVGLRKIWAGPDRGWLFSCTNTPRNAIHLLCFSPSFFFLNSLLLLWPLSLASSPPPLQSNLSSHISYFYCLYLPSKRYFPSLALRYHRVVIGRFGFRKHFSCTTACLSSWFSEWRSDQTACIYLFLILKLRNDLSPSLESPSLPILNRFENTCLVFTLILVSLLLTCG